MRGKTVWFLCALVMVATFTAAAEDWQDTGPALDVRLCGCRVVQEQSGALTGRVCGCQVLEMNKGDILLFGVAVAALAAMSVKQK